MRNMFKSVFAAMVAITCTTSVMALPINIVNPSFEDNVLADNGFTTSISGWTITGAAGTYHPGPGHFNQPVPDGNNTALLNAATLRQNLNANVEAGVVYTLLAFVGDRTITGFPGWSINLLADGDIVQTLNSTSINGPANGEFIEVMLNYSATGSDPHIGTQLSIQLNSIGAQTHFDNIRLVNTVTAEIPEPAAALLLGLAGLAMFRRRNVV